MYNGTIVPNPVSDLVLCFVRFETDSDLLNKYYYNRHGQSYEKERICDARCQKRVLCEVNNIISTNAASCTGF